MNISLSRIKNNWVVIIISIIGIANLAMLAILIWLTYITVYAINPAIVFRNIPFPVEKSVYTQGETIKIFIDVCRYTDIPSTVFTELHNSSVVPLPPAPRTGGRIGCYEIWSPIAKIPLDYTPSKGVTLWGKAQIVLNPWATRVTNWHTEPFEVVKAVP